MPGLATVSVALHGRRCSDPGLRASGVFVFLLGRLRQKMNKKLLAGLVQACLDRRPGRDP